MKNILYGIFSICLLLLTSNTGFSQNEVDAQLANAYYSKGDFDKAMLMYEKLVKDYRNVPLVHNNYLFILIEEEEFGTINKYLKQLVKRYPQNIYYRLDMGYAKYKEGKEDESRKFFNTLFSSVKKDVFKSRLTAEYLVNKQLPKLAIDILRQSRAFYKDESMHTLEMANIYRIMGEKEKMVEEYLNFVIQNPSNLDYVQTSLQNLLTESEELEALEGLLYEKVQQHPTEEVYAQLLIWVNLQQQNFYGAFVQAKAIDRRKKTQGTRSLDIGFIALKNKDYDTAIKIFSYVIEKYPKSINYRRSRMYLIKAYEEKVKTTYPVQLDDIRSLVADYGKFIDELGANRTTLEAMRNKALLHAFYLDEKDSAVQILNRIIATPRANRAIKSKSKLNLGDIYLLMDQPWESTLLYAQVEKTEKDNPIGYEAKLKNAKLSYYKGEFSLAEEHLDILKQATTRKISNDAIALSLLIKDNIALDSTEEAMQSYATIELLLFQHKEEEAIEALHAMQSKFEGHSLTDELLWLEADIMQKEGDFDKAVNLLKKIVEEYDYDVLSDDAYFRIAEIYDKHLDDKKEAKRIYEDFLKKYPGSVYVAEARKRFRTLRGDFENKSEEQNDNIKDRLN